MPELQNTTWVESTGLQTIEGLDMKILFAKVFTSTGAEQIVTDKLEQLIVHGPGSHNVLTFQTNTINAFTGGDIDYGHIKLLFIEYEKTYSECILSRQHPVDYITTTRRTPLQNNRLIVLHYLDNPIQYKNVSTNDYSSYQPIYPVNATFNGENYELLQFHFHSPSENTFNGKTSDIELHFVHKHVNSDALLICAFFVNKELSDNFDNERVVFDNAFHGDEYISLTIPKRDLETYYYTAGSTTTPPYTSNAAWLVFPAIFETPLKTIVGAERPRETQRTITTEALLFNTVQF
jgi:carbonic anhydrase